jgi:hypothetical protein
MCLGGRGGIEKVQNPKLPPSGRKVSRAEREKERKITNLFRFLISFDATVSFTVLLVMYSFRMSYQAAFLNCLILTLWTF